MDEANANRIFASLRAVMLDIVDDTLAVSVDRPGELVVRTRDLDAKGQPGWFGTVTIKRSYVAYHIFPLYERQEALAGLPDPLEKRRHGKTCFNFTREDPAAFAQLAALTRRMKAAIDAG